MSTSTFTPLRTVTATRYVTPLREGGSLPALVEADDDGLYVLKFRGAGQGPKALVAELVGGEIARAVGLRVPEIVLIDLDPEMARAEPDPEIQDLIRASAGVNVGLDYLPGLAAVRAPHERGSRPGVRRRRRLAGRVPHERRPHAAQPEPPALARQRLAHRPRRGALSPARGAGSAAARAAAVRPDRRPRPAALRGLDPRGRRAARAAALRRRVSRRSSARCRRRGWRGPGTRPTSSTSRAGWRLPGCFREEADAARS